MDKLIKEDMEEFGPKESVSVGLYTRYLKRIQAHLLNIASSVVNPNESDIRLKGKYSGRDQQTLPMGEAYHEDWLLGHRADYAALRLQRGSSRKLLMDAWHMLLAQRYMWNKTL